MKDQQEKGAYSKKEGAQWLGVSDQVFHRLTKTGEIRTVRAGRRVLVPRDALLEFLKTK